MTAVAASAVDSLMASSAASIDPNESESSNRRVEVSISKMSNGQAAAVLL